MAVTQRVEEDRRAPCKHNRPCPWHAGCRAASVPGRIRTSGPLIRSQVRYPLRHRDNTTRAPEETGRATADVGGVLQPGKGLSSCLEGFSRLDSNQRSLVHQTSALPRLGHVRSVWWAGPVEAARHRRLHFLTSIYVVTVEFSSCMWLHTQGAGMPRSCARPPRLELGTASFGGWCSAS